MLISIFSFCTANRLPLPAARYLQNKMSAHTTAQSTRSQAPTESCPCPGHWGSAPPTFIDASGYSYKVTLSDGSSSRYCAQGCTKMNVETILDIKCGTSRLPSSFVGTEPAKQGHVPASLFLAHDPDYPRRALAATKIEGNTNAAFEANMPSDWTFELEPSYQKSDLDDLYGKWDRFYRRSLVDLATKTGQLAQLSTG